MGLAWYLAALLPALAVSLNTPWSEHRSYLALPGLVMALGFILERLEDSAAEISRGRVRLVGVMTMVMLALMGVAGAYRSALWSSPPASRASSCMP